jgi:coenzyme PQQ synthesis protein D (PqqD)
MSVVDEIAPSARARVPAHVVYQTFVNETVILNLKTGQYHGLNPTGGRMLNLLAERRTIDDAARELAAEYKRPVDELERDLVAFCGDLAARGLIEMTRDDAC